MNWGIIFQYHWLRYTDERSGYSTFGYRHPGVTVHSRANATHTLGRLLEGVRR